MAGPMPLKRAGSRSLANEIKNNVKPTGKPPPGKPAKELNKHAPLGDPPSHLNIMECGCWHDFKREIPWLTLADSTLVEMACRLRAQLVAGELGITNYGALTRLVLQLRGTAMAVDRQATARNNDDGAPEGSVEDEMFG